MAQMRMTGKLDRFVYFENSVDTDSCLIRKEPFAAVRMENF